MGSWRAMLTGMLVGLGLAIVLVLVSSPSAEPTPHAPRKAPPVREMCSASADSALATTHGPTPAREL